MTWFILYSIALMICGGAFMRGRQKPGVDTPAPDVVEFHFPGTQRRINTMIDMLDKRVRSRDPFVKPLTDKAVHDRKLLRKLGIKKAKL